ncbi:MAG TPA: hypothetical protein VGO09_08195, partial [Flavisolibacter sp.]|nr:hypothetical protein [Flavisolibacter sp.]
YMSEDNALPFWNGLIFKLQLWIKKIALSEEKSFGLESGSIIIEKYPILIAPVADVNLTRAYKGNQSDFQKPGK